MALPLVYADFHNADVRGRLRLNCVGTINDLARQQIQLRENLRLTLYMDDADKQGNEDSLRAEGSVTYSGEEQCWVAVIDWNQIRHASDDRRSTAASSGSDTDPALAGPPSQPTR
jgi:hypothetical protein